MGFYDRYILPHVITCTCGQKPVRIQRQKVVPQAKGTVLEVGFGSGLNLPHYEAAQIDKLYALEPDPSIRKLATKRVAASPLSIEYLDLPGEEIPLDNDSVDTVVITYTLCTIPDAMKALAGMRRVLKPEGRMLFSEHGLAPDPSVVKWQNRLDGLWGKIGGGCHLNRAIDRMIIDAGFIPDDMQAMYIPGPKFASYHYWGSVLPGKG